MTRTEIKDRVVSALGERDDTATVALINSWIVEVIKIVEHLYPLSYTRDDSKTISLSSGTAVYALPTLLIYEHEYYLQLQALTGNGVVKLDKIDESQFDRFFADATTAGTPTKWMGEGGNDGNDIRFYPVPDATRTVNVIGYFYTDTSAWSDSSSNWLTTQEPNLIIEGTKQFAFEFYGQDDKAQRSYAKYIALLNGSIAEGILGLVPSEKKKRWHGRHVRIKTFGDLPLSREKHARTYS